MRKTYRIQRYEHPKTGEIFKENREDSDKDRPHKAPDGVICPRKPKPGEGSQRAPGIGRRDQEPPLRPVRIKL